MKREFGFDVARVICIFVVIGVYHNLGYCSPLHADPVVRSLVYASLGVFTFLSAFLLSSKYTFYSKKDLLDFYKKRVIRIYPLFFLASILLMLFGFNDIYTTLKGLLGISPFLKPHPTTMWYIAMLISLYIITPFVIVDSLKKQLLRISLVMSFLGVAQLLFGTIVPRTFNYYTVYFIGIILGSKYHDQTMHFLQNRYSRFWVLLFMGLLVGVFVTKNPQLKSFSAVIGIVAILTGSMFFGQLIAKRKAIVQVVTFLSYSSMCAYLYHRLIFLLMFRIYTPSSVIMSLSYILFFGVPLSFVVAYYIQKYYDKMVNML